MLLGLSTCYITQWLTLQQNLINGAEATIKLPPWSFGCGYLCAQRNTLNCYVAEIVLEELFNRVP